MLFPRLAMPEAPERILVHLVGNVGDITVASPMLRALGDQYPNATLRLLTASGREGNAGAVDLLRNATFVHEVHSYLTDDLKKGRFLRQFIGQCRAFAPDLIVLCPSALTTWRQQVRNLVFARVVGANFVGGLDVPTILWALDSQVRDRRWFKQETQRYLDLLVDFGIVGVRPRTDFGPLPVESSQRVDAIAPAGPFIAVCPGGKQVAHRWPEDRFRSVLETLAAETDLPFVAVGTQAERDLCERVLDEIKYRATNTAGCLDLPETAELLSRCSMLLTNDTGPMHLAAAAGVPVVAIFGGAQPPGRWYPWASDASVLRAEAACPECLGKPDRPHCVGRIPVHAVIDACRSTLTATREGDLGASVTHRQMHEGWAPVLIEPSTDGWTTR